MQAGFDDQGATSVTAEIAESQVKPQDFFATEEVDVCYRIPGCVYVIQWENDGPVKIGMAIDPWFRLKELQTANWGELFLRALVPTPCRPKIVERTAHRLAYPHWLRGEWFDLTPLEAVSTILDAAKAVGVEVKTVHEAIEDIKYLEAQNRNLAWIASEDQRRREMRQRLGMGFD